MRTGSIPPVTILEITRSLERITAEVANIHALLGFHTQAPKPADPHILHRPLHEIILEELGGNFKNVRSTGVRLEHLLIELQSLGVTTGGDFLQWLNASSEWAYGGRSEVHRKGRLSRIPNVGKRTLQLFFDLLDRAHLEYGVVIAGGETFAYKLQPL